MSLYGLILAGGSGTRLWPLSREKSPKFLLAPENRESFLELTIRRFQPLISLKKIRIVCGEMHVQPIRQQLRFLKKENFITEPSARNTAPAIGLAVIRILQEDPDAILVVLPADHLISDTKKFRKCLQAAIHQAKKKEVLVTVGVVPTKPHTGYGYIERGQKKIGGDIFEVNRFVEKPNLKTAKRYLKSRRYFWNAGIFVGRASLFLREFRRHMPNLYRGLVKISRTKKIHSIYKNLESQSIDYGVMEKSRCLAIVPGCFEWRDVGDLVELSKLSNSKNGIHLHSRNVTVLGQERFVVTLGVKDLIVVESGDALLIVNKESVQDVKKIVSVLKTLGKKGRMYV